MIRFTSEKAVAALSFATALGLSLVALPLVLDSPAYALDAKNDPAAGGEKHHHPLPSEMIEARLAYAKTALGITDAQSKQWDALATVLRKQAKDQDARITAMRAYHDANLTVVDRLQQRQKMMTTAAAELNELVSVVQPLYATLSPQQKEVADHLLKSRFGGGHGHFGGHH